MAEEAAAAAPTEEKKKIGKMGRKRLLLLSVGILVLLGAGSAGAFFWPSRGDAKRSAAADAKGKHESHGAAAEQGERGSVLSLEPFIVNLADPEGDRYIKCTMRLVLDRPEVAEAVKSDELTITRIRDRVLTLLSSKAFSQVATPEGKEILRKEIQVQVTSVLRSAAVSAVYYTEFIVQ
jgi:flagellar protein FliL